MQAAIIYGTSKWSLHDKGGTPFSVQPQRTLCYRYPTEKHPRGHVCIVYLLCAQPDCVDRSRPWTGRVGARRIVFFFSSVTISTDCFAASGEKENGTRRAERGIVSICQFPETFWQTPGNSLLVDVMWFGGLYLGLWLILKKLWKKEMLNTAFIKHLKEITKNLRLKRTYSKHLTFQGL